MSEPMYRLDITAQGEVRDQDGNLISTEPVTGSVLVSAAQLQDLTEGDTS